MSSRTSQPRRPPPQPTLRMPSLPRFHPANFPHSLSSSSTSSGSLSGYSSRSISMASTPAVTTPSPATLSPRRSPSSFHQPQQQQYHQRQYTNTQRAFYMYQREMLTHTARGASGAMSASSAPTGLTEAEPESPRLMPLGSPGPVTPLALENQQLDNGGDYLFAKKLTSVDEGKLGDMN